MIPKLHKKGSSFAGVAAYVLHDKGAATSERVAWTETRNLATENPHAAWRVMAATALDQNRLKREAGIKATGRKSREYVLHLTLSWHPDEAEGLTHEEMMRAARGAIRALGASDHQALIVAHSDEDQPHTHIIINRVSPTDGRLLSSSKERLALSTFAEGYERERGQILCEERVLNNAARARGEFTRGAKDKPRHIYELEAGNDNLPGASELREAQRRKDLELRRRAIAQRKRHSRQWADFLREHRLQRANLVEQARRETTIARQRAVEPFKNRWRALHHEQQAARAAFAKREQTHLGRASNALRQADWAGLLRTGRRGQAIRQAFGMLASSGERGEALRRLQQRQTLDLERQQREAQERAVAPVRRQRDQQLARHRVALDIGRQELLLTHRMDEAALRAAWAERRRQRVAAWNLLRGRAPQQQPPPLGQRGAQTTTPDKATRSAAEQFMVRMREARKERERRRGRDDDRGR